MRKILTRPTQITITAGTAKTFEAKLFQEYRWLGDEIDVTIAANDVIEFTSSFGQKHVLLSTSPY